MFNSPTHNREEKQKLTKKLESNMISAASKEIARTIMAPALVRYVGEKLRI